MVILIVVIVLSVGISVAMSSIADAFLIDRIAVFGSFAGFQLSHNPGIAFGLRLPPVVQEILIGIALIIVATIAIRSARSHSPFSLPVRQAGILNSQFAFGLILGGGIANIIDRIPDGLVTDFIQIGTFPTFNVADSCITIGAALLLWTSVGRSHKAPRNAA